MNKKQDSNEMFQTSHLIILLTYTLFSLILIAEAFLMSWEKWPLIAIAGGVGIAWTLHLRQQMSDKHRIWIYSWLIMFTFFFYGSHSTSTFDTAGVMAVVLILYTMTGMKSLITFLQIVYYIIFAYGLVLLWQEGTEFDSLLISRAMLHVVIVTVIGSIAKAIIGKWTSVLNRSKDEIETLTDATDRLNDFLANVSHEIRTPINAVIGLTGICIEDEDDEKKIANLQAVKNAGRRVAEQIGDILDYSEIDRKRLTNNYEDYMLASVLNDLINELKPYMPDALEMVIDVDPSIPLVMNTDVSKLRKILRHLMLNGLKYTLSGGVYVRISSEKETYGVNLLIEVTDTGIGMSEEETERVFERFYRVDSKRLKQGGGLGIGMSIVAGFVASLGGFMMLKSKPDEGTTVKVSIPQKVVNPESCMSVNRRESLSLGAFLHFDKFEHPIVRGYYNLMVKNIVNGLGVSMHRVDNVENLKKLMESVRLSHLFIGVEEYEAAKDYLESLKSRVMVVVVADSSFKLPKGAKARIMEKPFYCFPVVTVLNMDVDSEDISGLSMFCRDVRALVVDDEPMNLTVAKSIFNRYGMVVSTALSGMEAIDMCRENDYDIVFMDHMMPGMDGVEAMKHIKADRIRMKKYIPIVALTANAVSTAREMFINEGFDGFVSKPIDIVELERVMKKVLPHGMVSYERTDDDVKKKPGRSIGTETADNINKVETADVRNISDAGNENSSEPVDDTSEPVDDISAVYESLAAIGIDSHTGLSYCMDDDEFYKSVLMDYAGDYEGKRGSMEKYYAERDFKNYEILVHALKSTSKMIGAMVLSEAAKGLENAAREKETDYIIQHHDEVMAAYARLTEGIIKAYNGGEDK